MNLARRILEGIHEVELQVTPEFQMPEEPNKPGVVKQLHMRAALQKHGWKKVGSLLSIDGKKTTETYSLPGPPGARVFWTMWNKTGEVLSHMTVSIEGQKDQFVPATSVMVAEVTTRAHDLASSVRKHEPTAEDEIGTVADMLGQIGWVATSDDVFFAGGGRRARVFEHPRVTNKIRVVYWKADGALVTVLVLTPDDNPVFSLETKPEIIYKMAQELMKEAGV